MALDLKSISISFALFIHLISPIFIPFFLFYRLFLEIIKTIFAFSLIMNSIFYLDSVAKRFELSLL
jgi:hypothetical protein